MCDTTRSTSSSRLGTSFGDEPKSAALLSGNEAMRSSPRTWNRHVSPIDVAVHEPFDVRLVVNCTPSSVANAPR